MRLIEEMLEPGMNLMDLITRCRNDFKFFFETVLGFNEKGGLNDYKSEWFNLVYDNDYVMIRAPSGFAKTVVLGVAFPIWWAFTNEKSEILLISNTISQSKISLLMKIRDLIDGNELLKKLMKPESRDNVWSQTMLKTNNGTVIFNRPYTISLKGARGNIIILDEIESYEKGYDIFFDHVLSRLKTGGKIIGISTPEEGTGTIMSMIEYREATGEQDEDIPPCIFRTYTAVVDYSDYNNPLSDGTSIWDEEFPIKELKIRLKRFGREKWYKNFMCDTHTESEDSIFKAEDIRQCVDASLKYTPKRVGEGEVYIGVDFAISSSPTGDFDAYVVIEKFKDTAYIKFAETVKGIPVEEKVRKMEILMKKYNPAFFICDESTFGIEVIRQARNKGIPIVAQSFMTHERGKLLANLISLISNHKVIIPKHPDDLQAIEFSDKLEFELMKFIEKKNEATGFKTLVSKGKHDDSLCSGTSIIMKEEMIKNIEDIKVGEEVLTHKNNYKKVVGSMSKECERDIITIKSFGGLSINVTDNHKIFTVKKNKYGPLFRKNKNKFEIIEVNSQDIDKNKHLLIFPINRKIEDKKFIDLKDYIPTTDGWEYTEKYIWNYRWKEKRYKRFIPIDKDFCFFIGHFAGDGCYKGDIAFHKKDIKLKNKIKTILESYGINVREPPQDNNKAKLEFCCIPFQNFLKQNVKSKLDKQIPDFCMRLNPKLQKEIFEGYRLADGTMVRNMIITATISKKLAYQMKYILLRNNIISSLRKLKRKRYDKINLDQYWLELNRIETKKYFNKKVGMNMSKARIIGDYLISTIQYTTKEKKLIDVYDIQVEDDFSFVAEGIAVHNSVMGLAMACKHVQIMQDFEDEIGVSNGGMLENNNNINKKESLIKIREKR